MVLEEWKGYLLVFIDNHVYLADSNADYSNSARYDWFYWEMSKNITCAKVKDEVLYLCTKDGIYTLTNKKEDRGVNSHWSTPLDEFNNPQYQKTTNKRGCVTDMKGTSITVSTRINGEEFEDIVTHENITSYVVNRIKKKKWKAIQLKFSSNKPFELFSCTLESYVGGYIKR